MLKFSVSILLLISFAALSGCASMEGYNQGSDQPSGYSSHSGHGGHSH